MQVRTAIFIVNYVVLWATCTEGFKSLPFGFAATAVSYLGIALSVVIFSVAAVLHYRFPKKHETASDFGELNTSGLYSYVRHPFYAAILALNYTVSLAALSGYAVVACTVMLPMWWYLVHMEEADLVRVWGQKYLNYQKNVPMFLPRLRHKRTSVV
jgi:protein-S-isoprenylcysteine O-methyltransferase Ste14